MISRWWENMGYLSGILAGLNKNDRFTLGTQKYYEIVRESDQCE